MLTLHNSRFCNEIADPLLFSRRKGDHQSNKQKHVDNIEKMMGNRSAQGVFGKIVFNDPDFHNPFAYRPPSQSFLDRNQCQGDEEKQKRRPAI